MSFKVVFFLVFFLYLALPAIFVSVEPFKPFCTGSPIEHFCFFFFFFFFLIRPLPRRIYRLKVFFFFSNISFGGHFVQGGGTILAILVEGHPRNIHMKLF